MAGGGWGQSRSGGLADVGGWEGVYGPLDRYLTAKAESSAP